MSRSEKRVPKYRHGKRRRANLGAIVVGLVFAIIIGAPVCCGQVRFSSVFASRVPELQKNQILVQRHIYLAAIDKDAKQPAWVAYRVSRSDWDTDNVLERNFSTPVDLRDVCLESSDYDSSGYDMGHMYALQLVSASRYAHEVNQLCAVAAQRPNLNRGPWKKVEFQIKELSETKTVDVIVGLMWLNEMPKLRAATETHKVASHCWVIYGVDGLDMKAYLFPQDVKIEELPEKHEIDPQHLRGMVSRVWIGGAR